MRKYMPLLGLMLLLALLFPNSASAREPYYTFYLDHGTGGASNRLYYMQDIYATGMSVANEGKFSLSGPSDLYIDGNDQLFVADTGNNRIVVFDREGHFLREIGGQEGKSALNAPEGVFVTSEGEMYVADTGNRRIAVFDAQGKFVKEFQKPVNSLVPKSFYFVPVKIVVDARGMMYIVSKGSYQGLVRIDKYGEFTGFLGGNKASVTLLDRIKKAIFTEEQMAQESRKLPQELSNITLDHSGFLFTATLGVTADQVKKLTAGGQNRLSDSGVITGSDQIVDIAADTRDFYYVLDRKVTGDEDIDSMISVFSPQGLELFTFGSVRKQSERRGVLSYPASIGIDSKDRLWVLDSDLNMLQAYDRTAFGKAILDAASDYYMGDYEKGADNWRKVSMLNETINLTYLGLGEAAQKEGRVVEAMRDFKISYDVEGYSEAFWTYRMDWLERNFGYLVAAMAGLWLAYRFGIRRLIHYYLVRTPEALKGITRDLRDCGYTMLHPYEGFYRIKGRNVSYWSLLIILLLVTGVKLASMYGSGYIFNPVDLRRIQPWTELLIFFVPVFTWVIANYLVSTVKDGEGRFREVLQASVFALLPYALLSVPVILLTNILVLEEGILVSSITSIMWLWVVLLFFVSSQVIHNFDFIENFKNSAITVGTIGIIWLFVVISAGLTFNLSDFIYQLYKEVAFLG
ncbi:YIP1 family protein [Paenibacillus glycanilyticus]|uniref:YIP1 family protein n=1 Tax=Paenibacillus glycanilyticus TaxID=126569 RepID=UPI0020418F5E|nr:YIP1 family protein [Paenibacillus glycanilyticus]MCM3627029.1 YIP1 family protein [Paenibacillus glycanilyticus]